MNKRTVLELLKSKAKHLGFSRKELARVASAIMAALPEDIDEADEESTINQKIDEYLPLLQVGQSAATRQAAASTRNMVDDDLEEYDDLLTSRRTKGNHQSNEDDDDFADAPRWAKRLAKMLEQGSDSSVKRRAKVEALVEDLGKMGKHYLRDFDRHSFKNNEEWEDYFEDLKDEITELRQDESDAGLNSMSRPVGAVPGRRHYRNDDEMTDEEVIKLARGE